LDDPIGKTITYPSSGAFTVIGVVRDFNFMTLHEPIMPFALFHTSSQSYEIPNSSVVVRVRQDELPATLATLENEWQALAPGTPFEYAFLDDQLNAQYETEQRLGSIFMIFAGLAILIACLGLLGLAAFTAERRTKEIGIRKTLGASVSSVVVLLTKDFTKWVILANVLAWPLAWFAMEKWLEDFAYRVDIGVSAFLMAGAAAFVIALLTVSYQALKAASANPVKALRAND
jgi:putative ABC transport system permease protein